MPDQHDFDELLEKFRRHREVMKEELHKVIIGQDAVIDQMLAAIFTGGHCLLVGVPGLAKTLIVSTIARILDVRFKRIQFTPDLMPSDITGTNVLDETDTGRREFRFVHGPVFTNVLLADEINRTPPKTQAAMLESMQERKVSIGGEDHPLPDPFFVLATQNPIEQEGTYPLPEAQLDRFMFMIKVDYPSDAEEFEIMKTYTGAMGGSPEPVLDGEEIIEIQKAIRTVPVADHVMHYAKQLVRSTRPGRDEALDLCKKWLTWGAGPRAGLALILAAKAHALLHGQSHVGCSNVAAVAPPIFRHRIILNFAAQSEGYDADSITGMILDAVDQNDFKA